MVGLLQEDPKQDQVDSRKPMSICVVHLTTSQNRFWDSRSVGFCFLVDSLTFGGPGSTAESNKQISGGPWSSGPTAGLCLPFVPWTAWAAHTYWDE